ncbi:type II secretion system minor pseudopilin GspH [Rheinheimera baltica]|uniref:Type II secretion system protein H n=1 Tax=Rheinheimera baltica TaxID=67576 RepID=A0ABT9HVJ2_9GAMM|nr:type II secretion system minor pseudopilin GspH [Rheinheimera baltica]MDP5135147.1 type II secretion system minor pseudopilin GspH [Rheinheimera baltica]MDP5143570.1 type II secretion system minor pseudopilin GspH [Rheinheimera baltica]MDP5151075.1 type II secretion system minor pseudopilin GspH [Rheinheimera baltica]MDP5189019.1 type II secretion system minor pseudopilin GspH [Rheinheimera baltica]
MNTRQVQRQQVLGFTLLELMLVILLIGLLASVVVINFAGESRKERLDDEAARFQQLFHFAAETAMLKQQEWGLYVMPDRYGFLYYSNNDAKWLEATEPRGLQQHILPEDITISLELEGLPGADTNLLSQLDWVLDDQDETDEESEIPVLPQVFVLSSGEISPFQLLFTEKSELTPLYSSVSTEFAIPLTRTLAAEQLP